MTGDTHVAGMTDAELDKLRTDCYAEGRKDETEAKAEALKAALDALQSIFEEVAGKAPPTDPNSYLPPRFVNQLREAIKLAEQEIA